MAERINISIPEDLYARLSNFKDRLNVSKMCQEAISHAVRIEEIKEKGETNTISLIARLKEESMQYGKEYVEKGFECGVRDAYKLSLDNFCEIQYFHEGEYLGQLNEGLPSYKDMFEFASNETKETLEDLSVESHEMWGLETMLKPDRFFINGWLNGVRHIWEKVRSEILEFEVPEPDFINPEDWGLKKDDEES